MYRASPDVMRCHDSVPVFPGLLRHGVGDGALGSQESIVNCPNGLFQYWIYYQFDQVEYFIFVLDELPGCHSSNRGSFVEVISFSGKSCRISPTVLGPAPDY